MCSPCGVAVVLGYLYVLVYEIEKSVWGIETGEMGIESRMEWCG